MQPETRERQTIYMIFDAGVSEVMGDDLGLRNRRQDILYSGHSRNEEFQNSGKPDLELSASD